MRGTLRGASSRLATGLEVLIPWCVIQSLATWSPGADIEIVGAVQGGTGTYGPRFDASLELVKTTDLTEACQSACASNGITRLPKPPGPLGYSKAFNGGLDMELPADAFNVARSNQGSLTHITEAKEAPSNVMDIVTGDPPTHSVSHYSGGKCAVGIFQTSKSFQFSVSYQACSCTYSTLFLLLRMLQR